MPNKGYSIFDFVHFLFKYRLLDLIECKQSISDFRNGFCVSGDHSYVLAPKGLVPVEELPSKVGLLEFDFDKFHETRDWESALTVKKRPKKQYDSMFLKDPSDPKSVDLNYHEEFCKELVFSIAQEATEESIFWNPFLQSKLMYNGGSIGVIPNEVRESLIGKEFNNFNEFRKEFWKTMSRTSYSKEFSKSNITRMKRGDAPIAIEEEWHKGNKSYILHHKQPISRGGEVYNIDNLLIVSPKMHQEILNTTYHFSTKGY